MFKYIHFVLINILRAQFTKRREKEKERNVSLPFVSLKKKCEELGMVMSAFRGAEQTEL